MNHLKLFGVVLVFLIVLIACNNSQNKLKLESKKSTFGDTKPLIKRDFVPFVDNGGSPFAQRQPEKNNEVPADFRKLCSTLELKSVSAFKKFMNPDPTMSLLGFDYRREIVAGYEEWVIDISKSTPDPKNSLVSSIQKVRVRLITKKNSIVFYEVAEQKNKKKGDEWIPYHELLCLYKNEPELKKMKAEFNKNFHKKLNERELFVTDVVYGRHCGEVGVNPDGREMVDSLVARKDKETLVKYLQFTNTEVQLYGYDGLTQLKDQGVQLTEREKRMMKLIASKSGAVNTCSGCLYMTNSIQDEIKELKRYNKLTKVTASTVKKGNG